MQAITILTIIFLFLGSCNQPDTIQKELTTTSPSNTSNIKPILKDSITNIVYKKHSPCSFSISLPSDFSLKKMYEDDNPDVCDYFVETKDSFGIFELHSTISSRFETNEINELYQTALNTTKIDIMNHNQKENWFVINGIQKENKRIVHWKRVVGEEFISDLHIQYPKSKEAFIAPYLNKISNSFQSK